jgi:hypothetical protein
MDKKKKISLFRALFILTFFTLAFPFYAQDVNEIRFCGCERNVDSITLFMNFFDSDGKKWQPDLRSLKNNLVVTENNDDIPSERCNILPVTTGKSIPKACTFSVLVDLSIPYEGKKSIYEAIEKLVEKAPDSCVYLSFFGDEVTQSRLVTQKSLPEFYDGFLDEPHSKRFYSAVYSKLAEFSFYNDTLLKHVNMKNGDRVKNGIIDKRAIRDGAKNYLFIFTEGNHYADAEAKISYLQVTEYQRNPDSSCVRPKVYAFYYTTNEIDTYVKRTLIGITNHSKISEKYRGDYKDSNDMGKVLKDFEEVINEASYDFEFEYKPSKDYGGDVKYKAFWNGEEKGEAVYSIGSPENVISYQEKSNKWIMFPIALLVTALTIAFFFFVMKILIPGSKSKAFAVKYYKKYVPEANVQRRTCHYCRQEILPGDKVVTRCRHIMHVQCWKQNGFKCAEYGQNCKDGIQEHIEWKDLFSSGSLRDLYLTILGICAGLVSWIVYVLLGQKGFTGLARGIAKTFLGEAQKDVSFFSVCVDKISAFLIIGLLLGFFLSLVLRYNDGVRKNDFKSLLKTFGLSLLSGVIGMAAFIVGSFIFCWIASIPGVSPNKWYCSFPAYLLFSICTSLSLIIKSTIPLKSALLGGIGSAIIGFLVLYFTNFTNSKWPWMNMLLNFIIYGGGIGASLVTVRMLAEKYFLIIKNGVKAGQRIPIHKWMNAPGGGNKVTIGMTERCEIQMTWEKSNKVAKEHVQLYVDRQRSQAMLRPLAAGVIYNSRTELPIGKPVPLSNNDTFSVGDTIFQYVEN